MSGEGGKQPGFKRVNLSFEDKDWKMISRYLEQSEWRYLPKGTALRHILLQDVTARNSVLQGCNSVEQDVTCPDPACAHGTLQEEIIEEVIPPKPPAKKAAKKRKSADLVDQEIASGIVAHLNEKAGTNFRLTGQSARQLISARLGEGYTVEDVKAVTEKKCAEWLGTKYESYLRPSTLFGKEKFEQYHGQKTGPQRSLDLTTEAGRAQCWKDHGAKQDHKPRPTLEEYLADD